MMGLSSCRIIVDVTIVLLLVTVSLHPFTDAEKLPILKSLLVQLGHPSMMLVSDPPDTKNVSPGCLEDLQTLLSNRDDLVPALDSFGKPASGMLVGNLVWMGHFDECMGIDCFHHCLVGMEANLSAVMNSSVNLPIQWGVCVPEDCSEDDVRNGLELLLAYLNLTWLTMENVLQSAAVCTEKPNTDFSVGFIATCTIFSVLAALSLLGSLLDYSLGGSAPVDSQSPYPNGNMEGPPLKDKAQDLYEELETGDTDEINNYSDPLLKPLTEKTPLLASGEALSASTVMTLDIQHSNEPNALTRLVLCFAISRNLPKILSTKQSEGGIPCLNGIRVMSIFWVILGHTLVMIVMARANENLAVVFPRWLNNFAFQAIGNAFIAGDTFFFLSGLLLTFLTLKRLKETEGRVPWVWFYIHRYIRLTPALGVLILVLVFVLPNLNQGPVWYGVQQAVGFCHSWWWADLLYINNFVAGLEDCISWAWYLAIDMQFFLMSPLIILPLFWYPAIGITALIATCLASFITSAVLVYQNNLLPGTFLYLASFLFPLPVNGTPSQNLDYQTMIYIKPYCRIPPYLVGMAMGYTMYRIGTKKVKMSPVVAASGWAIAMSLGIAVVYGLYDVNRGAAVPTTAASVVYASLSGFTFALALSWVVLACHYGYGGIINNFLSWSFWVPLSRLTYSVYLFHPIVIQLFAYSMAVPFHWSLLTLVYMFASFLTLSHVTALIITLVVEFPIGNVEKMLQQALKGKKRAAKTT